MSDENSEKTVPLKKRPQDQTTEEWLADIEEAERREEQRMINQQEQKQ